VEINEKYCKGCGICIAFCPKGVFEWSGRINERGYKVPEPRYLEKCVGCKICTLYCPDFAITVRKS